LLRRLIQGSFVEIFIVGTRHDDVEALLFWRCMIKSKRLILLLDMSKNIIISSMEAITFPLDVNMIYKIENKDKKQTKDVGLMGEFVQIIMGMKRTKQQDFQTI